MNTNNWENTTPAMDTETSGRIDRVKDMAHNLGDRAATASTQAKDWIGEHADQLSEKQKKLVDDTSKYVSANPLKSVAIAAVAALVVGRLMRWR